MPLDLHLAQQDTMRVQNKPYRRTYTAHSPSINFWHFLTFDEGITFGYAATRNIWQEIYGSTAETCRQAICSILDDTSQKHFNLTRLFLEGQPSADT